MCFLKSKRAWLAAPALWLAGAAALIAVGALSSPGWVQLHFDQDGGSPVEVATVGLFFFQLGFFWLVPPMRPDRRRALWLSGFSLITFFAICRELDWHKLLLSGANLPGMTRGTPFKLKFLTNPCNPLSDRLIVAACFAAAIALCAGTLLYFLPRLLRGLGKLHPVCWSVGFLGGTALLSQVFDRLPATLRHACHITVSDRVHALMTALEEGQELLLPLFVILATLQAHFIYNNDPADSEALADWRKL
jgi:hypothetical protein